MNKAIEIQTSIKTKTQNVTDKDLPSNRYVLEKECSEAHIFIYDVIKKLSSLDKLIFYDKYTDEISPELLYKYQKTDRCYETIAENTTSYHCLDCSTDEHAFILCEQCAKEHQKAGHLLFPHVSKKLAICHCGDPYIHTIENGFSVSAKQKCICKIHCSNEIYIQKTDEFGETRTEEEYQAIVKNVNEIFTRIETIGKMVIPQVIAQICENILDFLQKKESADLNVFILHIARWLNRVVRINPMREVIKDALKLKINTNGRFLLTNCIHEYMSDNKLKIKIKTKEESDKSQVSAHEIFLNLCIMKPETSDYFSRFLYYILDTDNEMTFISDYRKAYATIYFHGTSLPKELGAFLDKISIKTIIPHILSMLIVMIGEGMPLKDVNSMLHFTSLILLDEGNVMEILKRDYNLRTFIVLCDNLTMFPFPINDTLPQVLKMFHPIFISVITRLQVTKGEGEEKLSEMAEMHRTVMKDVGTLFTANGALKETVEMLEKIAFGRDDCKTEVDRSLLPSHFYLFSLFGYVAHLLSQSNEDIDIFQLAGIDTAENAKYMLRFSYLIYTLIHDKLYLANIFDIKEKKIPQTEVEDYMGEFTFPIIYSTLIFISHACLAKLGAQTFISEIKSYACIAQSSTPTNLEKVDCVILNFISMVCTFSRFGTNDKAVSQFMEYYEFNIQQCPQIGTMNADVMEYLEKTKDAVTDSSSMSKASRTRQSVSMTAKKSSDGNFGYSPAHVIQASMNKSLNDMQGSDGRGKKVVKGKKETKRISVDVKDASKKEKKDKDKGKSKLKNAEEITEQRVETKGMISTTCEAEIKSKYTLSPENDRIILQFRKKLQKDEMDDKQHDLAASVLKMRMEQQSMGAQEVMNEPLVWNSTEIEKQTFGECPDYFFPFANASVSTLFKLRIINTFLLEPIAQGNRKAFLTFVTPKKQIATFAKKIDKEILTLMASSVISDVNQINQSNYLFVLRYYWSLIVYDINKNLNSTNELFSNNANLSKILSTCYGFFFADICLFIPERAMDKLLDELLAMFQRAPFGDGDIECFRNGICRHEIGSYFFGNQSSIIRSMDITPFSDAIVNKLNKAVPKSEVAKKKK